MKGKLLLITLLVIIGLSGELVLGLTGTCSAQANFATLVCGGSPDSVTGFGAVDICGNCYPCGVEDSVCPEDFYSTVTQTQGNCRLCPDPDCTATIQGYVFERNFPVPNTQIVAVYNTNNKIGAREVIGTTNQSGYYIGSIPSGYHTLFTQFGSFQGPNEHLDITRGENVTFNFTINRGTCNSDCTVGETGVCSIGCNNIEGCVFPTTDSLSFTSNDIAKRCDGLEGGTSVVNLGVIEGNVHRFTCCTGSFSSVRAIKPQITPIDPDEFKNSATWNTPTTLNDESVTMKITVAK